MVERKRAGRPARTTDPQRQSVRLSRWEWDLMRDLTTGNSWTERVRYLLRLAEGNGLGRSTPPGLAFSEAQAARLGERAQKVCSADDHTNWFNWKDSGEVLRVALEIGLATLEKRGERTT